MADFENIVSFLPDKRHKPSKTLNYLTLEVCVLCRFQAVCLLLVVRRERGDGQQQQQDNPDPETACYHHTTNYNTPRQ